MDFPIQAGQQTAPGEAKILRILPSYGGEGFAEQQPGVTKDRCDYRKAIRGRGDIDLSQILGRRRQASPDSKTSRPTNDLPIISTDADLIPMPMGLLCPTKCYL